MALTFGLRAGLSQVGQWDQQINDLRQNEVMNQQAKLLAEKKAALFADDFDYNNSMNMHDNQLVKQFAQAKIREIGSFVNQNPDWETNVGKRAQYKQLVRELKDNPDLNRGLQSDSNYAQFTKDLAEKSKNPDLFDAAAYNDVMQQWKNYEKYGNQYAKSELEANELGKRAFVYQQPQDWVDLSSEGLAYGNKYKDFDVVPLPGGFLGSYQEVPKKESLNALAVDFYGRTKRQMDIKARQLGYTDPLQYARDLITAGIDGKSSMGDASASVSLQNARMNASGQAEPLAGNYEIDIVGTPIGGTFNPNPSSVSGDVFKEMFGTKPTLIIKSDDNTTPIDLTGKDFEPTGYNVYLNEADKKAGIKTAFGKVRLSKDEAQKYGILTNNWVQDDEINSSWRKSAKLQVAQNKDGKDVEYVSIDVPYKFNVNTSAFRGKYNTLTGGNVFSKTAKEDYQQRYYPVPKTQQDWDSMPSGASYKDSQGNVITKQ